MDNDKLNRLLNCVRSSPYCDELTIFVLKLASDSTELYSFKHKVATQKSTDKLYIKFTKREIASMPESVKIFVKLNDNTLPCHEVRGMCQIRYNRDGFHIEIASKNLKHLKHKFFTKLAEQSGNQSTIPLMKDFVNEWLKVKKISIKQSTFDSYLQLVEKHILPLLGDKKLDVISRTEIQDYLIKLLEQEKYRTAKKLKQLLSAIFDVAAEDYNIKSPLKKIILPHYEVKKGVALTKAEEKILVAYCINHLSNACASAILLLLYTGMRIGELATASLHDNYIECETEKIRKGYNKEHRRIPISPMLRKVMCCIAFNSAISYNSDRTRTFFKKVLPTHRVHDLRYTFITRAKECGCNLELVMLWDGHKFDEHVKSSAVDRGYTTYSDEYYFGEIEKIDYEL